MEDAATIEGRMTMSAMIERRTMTAATTEGRMMAGRSKGTTTRTGGRTTTINRFRLVLFSFKFVKICIKKP